MSSSYSSSKALPVLICLHDVCVCIVSSDGWCSGSPGHHRPAPGRVCHASRPARLRSGQQLGDTGLPHARVHTVGRPAVQDQTSEEAEGVGLVAALESA